MHVDDSTRKSGCYWNQISLMILIKMLPALRMFFFFSLLKLFWTSFVRKQNCWPRKITSMIVHSQPADMFEVKPYLIVKLAVPVGKIRWILCSDWLHKQARRDCQLWSHANKKFGVTNFHHLLFLWKLECLILVIVKLSNYLIFDLSDEKLSGTFTIGFLS